MDTLIGLKCNVQKLQPSEYRCRVSAKMKIFVEKKNLANLKRYGHMVMTVACVIKNRYFENWFVRMQKYINTNQ